MAGEKLKTAANGVANANSNATGNTKTSQKRLMEDKSVEVESAKKPRLSERTDYSRWRLLNERGRQTWHYLRDDEDAKEWPQAIYDNYFLGLPIVRIPFPDISSNANT